MADDKPEGVTAGPPPEFTAEEGGTISPYENVQKQAISNAGICFEVSKAYAHGYIDLDTMARMLESLKGRFDLVEDAEHLAHKMREKRDNAVQDIVDELCDSCICQECQEEGRTLPYDPEEDWDEEDEFYSGQITEIVDGAFVGQPARVISVNESKEEVNVELFEAKVPVIITVDADQLIAKDDDEDEDESDAPFEGLGSLFG